MTNPADIYRKKLHYELYMEHYENGDTDRLALLVEEYRRVRKGEVK